VQEPHPPLYIAVSTSPETVDFAASKNLQIIVGGPTAVMGQAPDVVKLWHTKMEEHGHGHDHLDPPVSMGVYVAPTMEEAERLVCEYVDAHVPAGARAPLAGNTVGMDKAFLERDMPNLMGRLHYRVVDVSSLKELVRRWYPRVFFNAPEKTGGHRALGDIQDSIRELRYYRETVLVPLPGPDSDAAKAAATSVSPDASAP